MTVQLAIGARNLTDDYSDLTFSNADPGGYEQLTCTVGDASGLNDGDRVTVRVGLDTAWHGRVNELGDSNGTRTQIAALGDGVKLTDGRISIIYADRDLNSWRAPSRARLINLVAQAYRNTNSSVNADNTGGIPAILTELGDPNWVNTIIPCSEAWYDAGECRIGSIYYDWERANDVLVATDWTWYVGANSVDDGSVAFDLTANLKATSSTPAYFAVSSKRYGTLFFGYKTVGAATTGQDGLKFGISWKKITVYGDHGLTWRGADPGGFHPADIVRHALTDSEAGFDLVADDSSSLIVRHSVYLDAVKHEQVIADMAKLMGWHYGTWEPASVLSDTPRLFFTAPPSTPTCVVARHAITDLDAPKVRVDRLYDTAQVRWTDAAGTSGVQTVTIPNPLAAQAGVSGRTLDLDMGPGDATSAATFGAFALQLALTGARGGGSCTILDAVSLPDGGVKPACLLKAGRDRIRILGLPDSGSLTAEDRQDSFLVRRVEPTVRNGVPSTRVEFDGGADLLEVLQARLALSQFSDVTPKPTRR